MARDAFETDVGGELRDRYGRPEYVLTTKHAAPVSTDTSRAYQPTDADGRLQITMQDVTGVDLSGLVAVIDQFAVSRFGAKGDVRLATDGVIAGGALGQVSSATLALTGADIGKTVIVLGVGPNVQPGAEGPAVPGVLATTISGVQNGVATLATPASVAGTGLTVKVGTDDTAAINAAMVAASARAAILNGGAVKVAFASGQHYLFSSATPQSNVLLDFTGATLHSSAGNSTGLTNNMMFRLIGNASIANWHIRGGTWMGTGTEAGSSGNQGIVYWHNTAFGQNGTAVYSDISIKDTIVTNWRTGVYDIRGGRRIRISGNTFRSCSWYTGTNTINVIMGGGASPVNSSDVFVQDNFFDDNGAEAIAIGVATNPAGDFDRAIVTGNNVQCTGNTGFGPITGGATAINVEWSTLTTGHAREVTIANNIVRQDSVPGGGASWCIGATSNASMPANPHYGQRIMVHHNICVSTDGGIVVGADDAIVTENIIDYASTAGNTLKGLQVKAATTLAVTADTNSSTTLTNVSVAASGVAENGIQLSGAGISGGTYLVSGAGTSTWIISLPATTTAAGVALTGWSNHKRNIIANNIVHTSTLATSNPIWISQIRDSRVVGNIVYVEPGNTTAGSVGAGMLVQRLGWTDVTDNRVYNSATDGILLSSVNDTHVERNRIYNPNQSTTSTSGITVSGASGLPFYIRGNRSVDDQAVHTMFRGINIGTTNSLAMLINNDTRGATDASPFAILSNYLLVRGNTSDSTTFPAATSGSTAGGSPYTTTAVPYPSMVSVVGGTVTTIQHNRTGSLARNLASYGGAAANLTAILAPGDTITITHTVAPTVNVFPLQ